MSARKHRSEAEWQALIAEQLQSGQSALAFCRDHGIYAKTFYKQRQAHEKKELRRESFGGTHALLSFTTASAEAVTPEYKLCT